MRFVPIILSTSVFTITAFGQNGLASLKTVPRPQPSELNRYVQDEKALAVLGKALFWDVQVGSDGQTACATCHFHAGADHRAQNQLANPHSATGQFEPNRTLTLDDFPFRKLSNPLDNRSPIERNLRQVAGSAGVVNRKFVDLTPNGDEEAFEELAPATFALNGVKLRQVTSRNTPSVINAIFYVLNFWDGRASNIYTGGTPFGDADKDSRVWVVKDGQLLPEAVRMENSSLASQAVGPALNNLEMSYDGRTWQKLARKILSTAPLGRQRVAADDSLLGEMANPDGNGLLAHHTYPALMRAAFRPEYWQSEELDADGYTQPERNFALFFGLAIQAYESLLVSDDSRFDRFMEGNRTALTQVEQDGIRIFNGNSECHECHQGPELSAASFTNVRGRGQTLPRNPSPAALGFFRTGVSPVAEDEAAAGRDSFGNLIFPNAGNQSRGVFKSPSLRNVELTGPYFHDGGQATLEQVLEFYSRQGDFPGDGNLGPGMGRINMSAQDRAALLAFMKSLTDERVKFERAPFDHPGLCIPVGHAADGADKWALIPAVGKSGNNVPLQTFEELLTGVGNDGSRAHTLTESCTAGR